MELLLRLIELIIVINRKKKQRAALEARRKATQKRLMAKKRAVGYRSVPVSSPKEKHDWDDKIVRLR